MKDRPLLIFSIVISLLSVLAVGSMARDHSLQEARWAIAPDSGGGVWILDGSNGNVRFERRPSK